MHASQSLRDRAEAHVGRARRQAGRAGSPQGDREDETERLEEQPEPPHGERADRPADRYRQGEGGKEPLRRRRAGCLADPAELAAIDQALRPG